MTTDLDRISVNMETGQISYPAPEGFVLDEPSMQRTARLFVAHCPPEQAVRLAIHQQLSAFRGARQIRSLARSLWPATAVEAEATASRLASDPRLGQLCANCGELFEEHGMGAPDANELSCINLRTQWKAAA